MLPLVNRSQPARAWHWVWLLPAAIVLVGLPTLREVAAFAQQKTSDDPQPLDSASQKSATKDPDERIERLEEQLRALATEIRELRATERRPSRQPSQDRPSSPTGDARVPAPLTTGWRERMEQEEATRIEGRILDWAKSPEQVKEVLNALQRCRSASGLIVLNYRLAKEQSDALVNFLLASGNYPTIKFEVHDEFLRIVATPEVHFSLVRLVSVLVGELKVHQTPAVIDPKGDNADLVWRRLGLRLWNIEPAQVQRFQPQLRGGMHVMEVRPGSPAAGAGLQAGDVLVGLHKWETLRSENIGFVLQQHDLKPNEPTTAHVLRDGERHEFQVRL